MTTNPINQQAYLTWCNRPQQACALELVSTFPERWAAGWFYILKCHCCQKVDGFPSVENKLRGEKRKEKKKPCYVGDSMSHAMVLLKTERLRYMPRIFLSSKRGRVLFVGI